MKKFLLVLFLIPILSIQDLVLNGVYNLEFKENNFLNYNNILTISKTKKYSTYSNFRIKLASNSYYKIEHIYTNTKLLEDSSNLKLIPNKDNELSLGVWKFIKSDENKYIIQNINKCYIVIEEDNLKCQKSEQDKAIKFSLIKVYDEVENNNNDLELIEKEPIDIIFKYIDLTDPDLKREGIPQIKKDEDNQELKYSVRSVLKYLPWVRKIYIIMPNKKVRYFKDYEFINEKIVYVNDKDMLGFDSANIYTFHFNFWRMVKYNISENIISMDDDYFIGQPLKKSDFFHVENGKVVPSIISDYFVEEDIKSILDGYYFYKNDAEKAGRNQTSEVFWYTVHNTFLFAYEIFNKSLTVPYFTHNAIPCNIKDIKEMYDLVYNNNKYKESTLDSIYRGIETLQFQTFYMIYTFNKYHKKVHPISYNYIDVNKTLEANYNFPLFCINTGAAYYEPLTFKIARIVMENNFPEPTPYEIIDFPSLPSLSLDIISELLKKNNKCKEEGIKPKREYNISTNIIIFICASEFLIIIIICYQNRLLKKVEKDKSFLIKSEDINFKKDINRPSEENFELMNIN